MLPFIISGRDSVELKKFDKYTKGDIVLAKYFTKEAETLLVKYVLHRILEIDDKFAILQGDGNHKSVKEKVLINNIIAKVTTIYFNGKPRSTDSKWQQFKYKLWHLLIPFRRYFLAIYRRAYSNRRSILPKN